MQQHTLPPKDADDDGLDLVGLLGTLVDHKWLIGGVTAAFCAAGFIHATLATPIYRADALVQVERKSGGVAGLGEMSEMLGAEPRANTEIELIKSRTVIGKAVDSLQLDVQVEPVRMPVLGDWFARSFRPATAGELAEPRFGLDGYAWGGERLELFRFELPPHLVGRSLALVVGEAGAYTLVDEEGRALLQGRVGAPAEANEIRLEVSELAARPGTRFTVRRASRLATVQGYQGALEIAERGRDTGIITLALESANPELARRVLDEIAKQFVRQNVDRMSAEAANSLDFLREQLPKVRQDLEKAEAALNAFRARSRSVDISQETQSVLGQIVAIDANISTLKLQQAEFDRRLTREHPRYQALLTQLGELNRQKAALATKVQDLPETQQELLRYARDVEVTTEIYTQLLNRTQELELVRAGTVGNARIIDTAVTTAYPVAPKKAQVVLVATLLGALAAIAFVLLRRALNRGVETPDAIEQLGLPVYAAVPYSAEQKRLHEGARRGASRTKTPLLAQSHPGDLAVESLRSLRTSLHFAMLEAPDNRLMISGPSPAVGKTFVSANLGAVIAQTGQRVLVVDVDMRKGNLHKLFGESADNGLSDVLARSCSLEQAIRNTGVEGLSFIPRGRIPPNPSELLMHANFSAFLDEAGKRFDLVILDTPPLLAVTDAAIVGRQAGTSLIVTYFGKNPAREIELTVNRFAQNGVDIKGAIFNGMEKRTGSYGGYHYYHYYQYEYKSEKA